MLTMKSKIRSFFLFIILPQSFGVRRQVGFQNQIRSQTPRPRVVQGWDDVEEHYPYVVTLLKQHFYLITGFLGSLYIRSCSGSLISSRFVITAAHCLNKNTKYVRCGNMTTPWSKTQYKSKILNQIPNPSFFVHHGSYDGIVRNDIALLYIEELHLKKYGRLHSADYKTLSGSAVRYAGYGSTAIRPTVQRIIEDMLKPLQIGEGVIFEDNEKIKMLGQPQLLVAPKCSKKYQHAFSGDSGGPLLVNGRIVGVACAASTVLFQNSQYHPIHTGFTPISPYVDWIRYIIANIDFNSKLGGQIHFKRDKIQTTFLKQNKNTILKKNKHE